jgi:hypothetical protein
MVHGAVLRAPRGRVAPREMREWMERQRAERVCHVATVCAALPRAGFIVVRALYTVTQTRSRAEQFSPEPERSGGPAGRPSSCSRPVPPRTSFHVMNFTSRFPVLGLSSTPIWQGGRVERDMMHAQKQEETPR